MLIVLVFTLGCIIGNAESQCKDIVARFSNQCGVNGNGGVCCNYRKRTILRELNAPYLSNRGKQVKMK